MSLPDESTPNETPDLEKPVRKPPRKSLHTNQAEFIKIHQARLKAFREQQRARIDGRHRYIITCVADRLELEEATVEEFLLDGDQLDLYESFFEPNGRRALLMYYQESETPVSAKLQQGGVIPASSKPCIKRLITTDGLVDPLKGQCVFFIRLAANKQISTSNIVEEVFSGMLEVGPGRNIIQAIEEYLSYVMVQAVMQGQKWGPLVPLQVEEFTTLLREYMAFLKSAHQSIAEATCLSMDTPIDLSSLKTPQSCVASAHSAETVAGLERLVETWCCQIGQLLVEANQMRREEDDTGPLAELEYWKHRTSKFSFLVEQLKSQPCRGVITTLVAAKSKALKEWRELDAQITDAANEAKDNLKYLYSLEQLCRPLYHSDPVAMLDILPKLMNTIAMIHGVSRYYNTSQRMTSLFVKITNQMVTACKDYITEAGSVKVWDVPPDLLNKKLESCNKLYHHYKECFLASKEKLSGGHREFEISEMYVFGKFFSFCRRLDQIKEAVDIMQQFLSLKDSHIEGIETLANKFSYIIAAFRKKPYNPLDHRRTEFTTDFSDLCRQVAELEEQICALMSSTFSQVSSCMQWLQMVQRFERLNLKCLQEPIATKYIEIVNKFTAQIDRVQRLYEDHYLSPPLVNNVPHISGRIMWSRQLLHCLQEPMHILKGREELHHTIQWKVAVKKYNKMGTVLTEYEILHHQHWMETLKSSLSCLEVPLMIYRDGVMQVNLDAVIPAMVAEAKWMRKLQLKVPSSIHTLVMANTKETYDQLKHHLEEYNKLCSSVPEVLSPFVPFFSKKVEQVLGQGLLQITWSSLTVANFLSQADEVIGSFSRFVKKVNDLYQYRILACLESISSTLLLQIPATDTWSIEMFLSEAKTHIAEGISVLQSCSKKAEDCTKELIELLQSKVVLPSINDCDTEEIKKSKKDTVEQFETECDELFLYFQHCNLEVLITSVKSTLDGLRKRIISSSSARLYHSEENHKCTPCFSAQLILSLPNILIQPSLEDIQNAINHVVQSLLDVGQHIPSWTYSKHSTIRHKKPATSTHNCQMDATLISGDKNHSKALHESKDLLKISSILSSAIVACRQDLVRVLVGYQEFAHLYTTSHEEALSKFQSTDPHPSEFETEMKRYEDIEHKIQELPSYQNLNAAIILHVDSLKLALSVEAKAWKTAYGHSLNARYRANMEEIVQFIADYTKRFSRPIKDLEDVRSMMASLDSVRSAEIEMDMELGPIEECYAFLQQCGVNVPREETERVDSIRYTFKNLQAQAIAVQEHLICIQPQFREGLVAAVEVFKNNAISFLARYNESGPMVEGLHPREASERLSLFQALFDELWSKYETYTGGEQLFGLPITAYPELKVVRKQLGLLQKLYSLYDTVNDTIDKYLDLNWVDVDIEKINNDLVEFQNRCRKLPKGLKEWQAFNDLKTKVDDFSEACPLLEMMANKAMKDRHWERIGSATGCSFDIESENFQLRAIMNAPILKHKEDIEDICISAVKERDIEAKLKQVIADWSVHVLSFGLFKSRGELLLKGNETSEIVSLMEDSLMVLGSLLSNRYNAPFKKVIASWVQKLSNTTDIIENWMVVQNLWVYLEAVFVGGDIAKQLPKEAKRFQGIDKSWVKIMSKARETPNVVQCCVGDETMGQLLPHLLEQLELCQRSLSGYLEKKRLIFPRFFFVSDPALLEILGQSSDSHTIQAHLLSIFDNIKSVTFHEKDYDRIMSIHSQEKEAIDLERPVKAQGNVEVWLGELLRESQKSLHAVIRDANNNINSSTLQLTEFLQCYPAQVCLLGIQMIWTRDAEVGLYAARRDKKIMQSTNAYFLELLNTLIEMTTQDLSKIDRVKYETLITIHVHQRDIFNGLVRMHVKSPTDFEWLKQSRFYFSEDNDNLVVSITNVDFIYQNEFLGCTERLVITPLNDRCYITLAQALGMAMGGAPAGPAGTGKTETVKDMGKALGKYVVVFNCSDQMDFRGLGRIYKGLAQSGSWGCFDEFNRIELPVLSVAAQQIYIILSCKKERKSSFLFMDGDVVEMNPEFGIFLTMNPGYAGRQELPENLKIQFRTVAMMVPDRQIIMRVKLASCGFLENVILARKFFTLYKLCEEQLSKQVHYDFGLRNILSVLRTLGTVKRASPADSENTTVMRVLRDMNLSKLVDEDEPLFLSLIEDLFPGIQLEKIGYPDLGSAIDEQVKASGLINHPPWTLKLIQLFETQKVRHGMMVLGPSGAGKTQCIQTLMKAMSSYDSPHREMRMNPKAITASQMFGRLDVATNDWTDGIFSTLWRRTHKVKKGEHIWLLLDGPVDAIWIENLNSVLDDNKTLTLANGDRIPMAPDCKIVFEPDNVDNASPATVSRNGMVYMSSSGLDWRPILSGWLNSHPNREKQVLFDLFDRSFEPVLNYVQLNLEAKMKFLECNYIKQMMDLLSGLVPGIDDATRSNMSPQHLERLYIFSLMWSLGALLELDDRAKLETFLQDKDKFELDLPKLQPGETIFEYVVDGSGNWFHWSTKVQEYIYPRAEIPEYASILVPNVDNVRTTFLIDTIAKQEKAVLLIGEQGTAKTVMVKGYATHYDPEKHLFKAFNFSSATTPMTFQRTIESYVDKRVGTTYGPPAGRKMTVFVDDINMPRINEWGDQVTNEIVRQLMEMRGFYSLEKPGDFTHIQDVQMMGAMIHPGGGRNDIPARLKRQFSIFNCTLPSNNSIDKIFRIIGMGYFGKERGFSDEIRSLLEKLVCCTRILWQRTKVKMLPTPAKFHYIFNLRDLSRIWEGMLHVSSTECNTADTLMALWLNECTRVISDRFTNEQDCTWFLKAAERIVAEEIPGASLPHEVHFVDFLRELSESTGEEPENADMVAPKVYEQIPSLDLLAERLQGYMATYNATIRGAGMDLVFFKDAMVHLMRISRVIRTDRGSALLVGVGGSGKQSLTRLASFIANYKIFQITLTRAYNVSNLLDDLKVLYRTAGLQGKGITFIFTDNEVKDEAFLEYLNNVLSSGEVSNLFARDELDEITSQLASIMKAQFPRRPPTQENLYDYFISRARKNLHVVLCFSPVGEKFRNRALKFPGLISGCTMDWFSRWPKDALIAVAQNYLSSFEITCSNQTKQAVVKTMGTYQDYVSEVCTQYFERYRRSTHVTPKSYLSFLQGYKRVYHEKKNQISELADRMNTGLGKLVEASESVGQLSKELVIKEKELAIASARADDVLKTVMVKASAAEKVKAEVQVVKDQAQALVDTIEADKAVAQQKLEAARPALEEAEAALLTIKATDISTVRKLGKPPHLIMRIMDCVLLLFQRKLDPLALDPERPGPKPSWSESLKMMSQTTFLQSLQNFSKDTINEEMVELLTPYLRMEDYNIETARKVCGNVAGLCSWTTAMAFFYTINKEVLPLKANLAIQEGRLKIAMASLEKAQEQLNEKQRELDEVQAMYDAAVREKKTLVHDAEACRRKMQAATALISGLGGEKERWTQQSKEFQEQIGRLVGDILLATAFLSYSGPFNQEFRMQLMKGWESELRKHSIPYTNDLNISLMLANNSIISDWNLEGLPNDDLSVQNGIIATKASRYPLLIDPQGQGKTWIKNREKKNDLQITTLNNKYFRKHLEDSLSLGKPLLIEDIGEELEPALDNVLEKNFIKSGRTLKVKVGDKEVDVLPGFTMYITTKLANPLYTPEISARTSIIDFTVTMQGLEDQLLGRVILTEKQELESQRVKLIEEVTGNKRKMKELEDNLLLRLSSTKGSLVDDESLIDVLRTSKETAIEVNEKLVVAADTEMKINAAREEYRPVATRGSILYFLIVEMSMVNIMYQTSLRQFLALFDLSMRKSDKSPIASKRISNIIECLTLEVFRYSTRGLYENHKFLFTLLLPLKIGLRSGAIKHEEFQTLMKGGAALDLKACPPKPAKWITDMIWLNLVELTKLPQFSQILDQVTRNERSWKNWFDKESPEEFQIPDGYHTSLDSFRKLLLIRCWCPDRALAQARKYISEALGDRYAEGVILDFEKMWEESDKTTPLICFLSMGADPTSNIEALAKRLKLGCNALSMGQGQEVHARCLLQQCMTSGGWLLLQNCHLGLDFMNELQDTLTGAESIYESCRIWITTEVHPKFPISLLQGSVKFTNEPPQGVKAGLKRTYANITQEQLDYSNLPQWKPLLYAVAFMHTTVQERRKFGPLGWNIPYEFNQADFTASVQFIQNHLDELDPGKMVCWNTVRYMLGEVQYGGRVTDDFDKRLLNTFTKVWFGDHMFFDGFAFYKGYEIPQGRYIEQFRDDVERLPLVDSPEAFGLHSNADITYQTNVVKEILETIINIQPKDSGGSGGETRESKVNKMAADMLEKLPSDYIPHEVKSRLQKMGPLSSMNIFLRQEIDRMQKVITLVRSTLQDLQLAIEGTIIMSENLRDALDCMYDAKVPQVWKKVSWESSTLGFWFTELLERNVQFFKWMFTARPNVFWMTGFFNPQGFLTAMRQEVTRAHKGWALDSVILHNDVTKMMKEDVSAPPPEGVYVHGLYLDGAGWDRKGCKLTESMPKVLFTPLPVIHLYAVNSSDQLRDAKLYSCPVYKKPRRTDLTYITTVTLRTPNNPPFLTNPDYWVLRGVALLCDTK